MSTLIQPTDLADALHAVCPIEGGRYALHLATWDRASTAALVTESPDRGDLRATLQLITYEVEEGGQRAIRDLKEQRVRFIRREHRGRAALLAPYVEGWAQVVREAFEADAREPGANHAALEAIMPDDLVTPQTFGLVRPKTAEAFAAAFRRRSRLGRWLGGA